jgi:hypothetical protein
MKYVEINGCCLNIDERLRIELGSQELKSSMDLDTLYFWGKIIGTCSDYFVVYAEEKATEAAKVKTRKYFWASSTNFVFNIMPSISADVMAQLAEFRCTMFSGEYDTVLIKNTSAPVVINAEFGIV